jgi:hypothetical protein
MSDDSVDPLEVPWWLVFLGYVLAFLLVGVFYLILHAFWGEYVLLDFSDLNKTGLSFEGLGRVWFIFVWALGMALLGIKLAGRPQVDDTKPVAIAKGLWLSANAGFWEELIYRWLVFFGAMITLPFLNWISFGFFGWLYRDVLVPLANWSTFGALDHYLTDSSNWVLGAAIVSASISFRDAHKYLGLIGWVNAWFGGMVMFWLVLNYGLVTAIVAHAVYDAIIFTTRGAASTQSYLPYSFQLRRRKRRRRI